MKPWAYCVRGVAFLALASALWAACSATDANTTTSSTGSSADGGATAGSGGAGGGESAECVDDADCGDGEICRDDACVMGCSETKACEGGLQCCDGACFDLSSDLDHCGSCDNACVDAANMSVTCSTLMCNYGACDDGFFNCDGDTANGCESDGPCSCTPGATQPCYPGPPGTQVNAPCQLGSQICNDEGTAWSLCYDFVIPSKEICNNGIDEDCTSVADDVVDVDSDGWTRCDGDCCETSLDYCDTPLRVNPGAFEALNNSVDDDCNPATSDTVAPSACSTTSKITGVTANDLASAIDLCQTTTASPPLPQRTWGLISATLRHANGTLAAGTRLTQMQNQQGAVMTQYGNTITPQVANTMMGISTGNMRYTGQPNFVVPGGQFEFAGTGFNIPGSPPAGYLAANGGVLPGSLGCSGAGCPVGSGANDSINVRLQVRVPTNALSFKYQFRYFTGEFKHYTCSVFNDFYLALLTTGAAGIPADGNISFDSQNNPVSVNNGFFDVCIPQTCYTCPSGNAPLAGTGMDTGGYGGGTDWLQTTAPVIPGETITLDLMVFDVQDDQYDSLVLVDAFEWSLDASDVGTGPPG